MIQNNRSSKTIPYFLIYYKNKIFLSQLKEKNVTTEK